MTQRPVPKNTVEEEVFRDACRAFAHKEVLPRRDHAEATGTFPRDLYTAACAAGLIGLIAPESLGGGGFGVEQEVILIEEIGKINPNLALLPLIQGVAGQLLWAFGTDVHHDIARRNIAGECLLALAVTEPEAGSDVQNVKTRATRVGDEWELDGMKAFISLGDDCDVMLVLAQTDPSKGRKGMQFFAVDRRTPGIETSKMKTYANRAVPTYRVNFNKARVHESRRLDAGFGAIMAGFNRERILVSARWLGHMQSALAWALDYARVRHQFGKPIGSNQGIAFPLAQSHVDVECTRQMTYAAARKWDSGCPIDDLVLQVSTTKLFATQAVYRVTQAALHTGGGWGLTEELPAMRFAIDAMAAPVTVGAWEIQLRAIAKKLDLPCE